MKKGCRQCRMVKKFLKDHHANFEEVDAGTVKGRAEVIEHGFRSLPLVIADGFKPFVGFNVVKLKELVEAQ
ncbi:MAG: glutaredoxin domain-containing protein [Aerococcus sp.]|nr:glutaredoxin domain-containing protein [Aerococcus sp.]